MKDDNQALPNDQVSAPEPGTKNGVNDQAPPPDTEDVTPPEPPPQYNAVDDQGVPYQNRLAESERKRIEAEAKAKAYEEFYANQQAQPQPQQQTEKDWYTLATTDFNTFVKEFREDVKKEVKGEFNQTLKVQSEQRVIAAHPELLDKDSELSKQVRIWAKTMRDMGVEPTAVPNGLETIVNTITKNVLKNGKPKSPSNPPIPQGGNDFFTPGKPPAKPQAPESKMTDSQKQLVKAMGLGDKSVERLEKRYARGDFEIGGG